MEKEIDKIIQNIKENNIEKARIDFVYYSKGTNNNWYCEYYYYDDYNYLKGKTKATGYGYNKESTCLSNAINIFSKLFTRYNKKAKKYNSYGLYDDNSISYGIGTSSVLSCLKCFKNVKIKNFYDGIYEHSLTIEIDFKEVGKHE